MTLYGVVWYAAVLSSVMLCGVVWSGMVSCDVAGE
jgi:hypothetical protein